MSPSKAGKRALGYIGMGCSSSRATREEAPVLATGVPKQHNKKADGEMNEETAKVHNLILERNQRSMEGRQNQVLFLSFLSWVVVVRTEKRTFSARKHTKRQTNNTIEAHRDVESVFSFGLILFFGTVYSRVSLCETSYIESCTC